MSGYQADIGEGYWGSLYDESRRNKILVPAAENALKALKKSDWNHYVVSAIGDHITLSLNGVTSVDYKGDRSEHRSLGAGGGSDSRGRADGSPVQGHDDSVATHADGR